MTLAGWKRICAAIDFSEASRDALDTAADLARASGAELTLAHVREVPLRAGTDMLVPPAGFALLAAEELDAALAQWRKHAERLVGRPVRARLLPVGEPAHELVRLARDEDADLVVLGTHGRSGVTRLVLGSVAERVLRHAPCPVLVVRRKEEQRATIEPPRFGETDRPNA